MLPFRDYNPTRHFPLVTIALIICNVMVFLYMLSLEAQGEHYLEAFVQRAAVIPAIFTNYGSTNARTLEPFWLTVFTAMFMHAGPVHLLGNLLYLWIFGNNVEDIMGGVRFLLFYLVCGIVATAAYILSDPQSTVPSLGASGAIAGVLGAYLVRFPRAQVDSCLFLFIFVTVVRLPAFIVLAFWFVLQLFSGFAELTRTSQGQGGVAYWAHIGGFFAGMVLVTLFARSRRTTYA